MKRIPSVTYQLLLLLLIGSVASTKLEAQYNSGITVHIPFAFTAGGQNMAAGVYTVEQASGTFSLLLVDVKTGHRSLLAMRPGRQQVGEIHGQLVFVECGGRVVLSEVRIPGTGMSSEVLQGHSHVHSYARACVTSSTTSIALR